MPRVKRPRLYRVLILGMMLVFFGQLCLGAKQLSLTSDEPAHIANGYAILTTRDLWSVPAHGHPPLANAWNAWPLLLQPERPDVTVLPGWHENLIVFIRNLWGAFGSLDRLAYVTRYPNMLLATLLMALVSRWARQWRSSAAACLALLLMTFDPTMLAHAQLNTTDLGFTLSVFAAFYLGWRLRRRFSVPTLAGIGIACGAAMGTKASGVLVPPLVVALFGSYFVFEALPRWVPGRTKHGRVGTKPQPLQATGARWLARTLGVLLLSALTLWAAYGFPLRPYPFAVHAEMLRIFFAGKDRLAFANGELRTGGWWWYFPFAFVIKTPLPAIAAYLAGLALTLKTLRHHLHRDLALALFPCAYLITALVSGVNIGYRHLLPLFPFLYVVTGRSIALLVSNVSGARASARHLVSVALGAWYVVGTALVYPFPIAYFNELVAGPKNGYRYLVDSNVDWGQSFKHLKAYMEQQAIPEVWISYFTWVDPGAYGIRYRPLFPGRGSEPYLPRRYDPAPGVYALSATTLQGIALKEHDPDLYEWFRHRTPQAQPGYGLLVYEVEPHDPPATWIAQCSTPVVPLNETAIREGLGRTDLRRVTFDCTQAWVVPGGGRDSGWYALAHATWTDASPFIRSHLDAVPLSYEQATSQIVPAFALFEWQGAAPPPSSASTAPIVAAPIACPPSQAQASGERQTPPVEVGEALTFLGYRVVEQSDDDSIELWTTWRVRAVPARPLSLIGHLVQDDGRPIAVGDGLGVPLDQWQAGDLITQRHRFELPPDALPGTYWLQTGAYWLDTLERLPVQGAAPGTDRLLLTAVEVDEVAR